MSLKKLIAFGVLAALFSGCASQLEKRNEVEDLDTKLEGAKEVSGGDRIGIRDNKMKVQKKVLLVEELRRLENETYGLEYEVYGNRQYGTIGLYGSYRDCHTELNSASLGGSGKLKPIEPAAPVINEDPFFKFGKDESGELVGVSEEYLSERIDRFKKYREVLEKRRTEYETKVRICENDLKNAKFKSSEKTN